MLLSSVGSAGSVQIHWYIMTSPFTDDATRKFFESHKYFGLEADQVRSIGVFSFIIFLLVVSYFSLFFGYKVGALAYLEKTFT